MNLDQLKQIRLALIQVERKIKDCYSAIDFLEYYSDKDGLNVDKVQELLYQLDKFQEVYVTTCQSLDYTRNASDPEEANKMLDIIKYGHVVEEAKD